MSRSNRPSDLRGRRCGEGVKYGRALLLIYGAPAFLDSRCLCMQVCDVDGLLLLLIDYVVSVSD